MAYEEAMDGREKDRDSVASVVSSAGDGIVEEGLVRDLLRAETWRVETLPRATRLAARETTTTEEDDGALAYALYLTAYHETVVCNLLELVVFANGGEWMVNASDEVTTELVEYCHRAATRVVGDADDGRDDEAMTLVERRVQEIEFALSMTCLGILRSVTDVIADVSLGVRARLLDSLDVVSALATLLEKKPWIRRTRDDEAALEIYTDGAWRRVGKTEEWDASLRVQKYEAQVWLSLRALLCDASCRRGYEWDEQRKSTVLKLGRYLNETKMDQLPVLRDLAGVLEENLAAGGCSLAAPMLSCARVGAANPMACARGSWRTCSCGARRACSLRALARTWRTCSRALRAKSRARKNPPFYRIDEF